MKNSNKEAGIAGLGVVLVVAMAGLVMSGNVKPLDEKPVQIQKPVADYSTLNR